MSPGREILSCQGPERSRFLLPKVVDPWGHRARLLPIVVVDHVCCLVMSHSSDEIPS